MTARSWSAQTTPAQAPLYREHLQKRVLPELKKLDGFAGVTLLERKTADVVEIVVITLWRSMESIRNFAGAKLEDAVVAEEAARLLTQFDRRVKHYDVLLQETV